jgi:outer membrane protein OmpA-like peptidoglycan-associated protein
MVLSVNFHPTKKARPAPQPTVEVVEKVVVVEKPAEASPLNLEDHNSTMYFEKGSSELTKADFLEIKKISDYLHDQPNSKAYIEGHCDCDGPDDLNLQLSEERANSVRQVLLDYHGIAEDRVLIEAYGEKFPVATNDTEEGRQQNRRVRVVVTNDPWL